MRLLHLGLRNYRNYERLELEPAPHLNVFLGRNGQGKTNLLEAVAMLALSSSPRARREVELLGPVADRARIEAVVERDGRRHEMRIEVERSAPNRARRRITVDGQPRRAVDLPGTFNVVLFWPDDLNLAKAGAEHRRRLLNHMLVQIETGYASALTRYTRVVEQRNHLLRQIQAGEAAPDELDVWDLELCRFGETLVQGRRRATAELARAAAQTHRSIAPGETLELSYRCPPDDLPGAVREARRDDLRRGATTVGPHRDDIEITLGGRDTRAYASQGQQRTAVVSIKLAEAQVVGHRVGEPPVLLLDDVLSELDADRRSSLLAHLGAAGQVVVTSVEAGPFPREVIGRSRVAHIDGGHVQEEG
ncbi:MAG: DNA replication/repair protein RecF [Candidatus Dormibacteraceae bacterium]